MSSRNAKLNQNILILIHTMADFKDLEAVFTKFDQFIDIIEQQFKILSAEEMLDVFKCCFFIEKTTSNLKEKCCLEKFLEAFQLRRKKRNQFKFYDVKIFLLASDYCLKKIMKTKMSAKNADLAVRIYSSVQSSERFQGFLEKYINDELSYKTLYNFSLMIEDVNLFSCRIILALWSDIYAIGLVDQLKEAIDYKLTDYKLHKIVKVHVTILSLESEKLSELTIQGFLLNKLENHMKIRNKLIENFWMILIFNIDPERLCKVFLKHPSTLELMMMFVIYTGSMMHYNKQKSKWFPNMNTFCPKLTYKNLVDFLKSILIDKVIIDYVHNSIKKASGQCNVWFHVFNDVFLS